MRNDTKNIKLLKILSYAKPIKFTKTFINIKKDWFGVIGNAP